MAISAASVFEIQTGGNDTNGGGFVAGASGTDYSQVAAKRTGTGTDDSTTDAVANGTTTLTSATANFGTSIVGNIISLSGGTGALAQTWRQVVSRTNATTIVLDASVAAGTGITMNIGGALASPGGAGLVPLVSQNIIWLKAGTYSVTSTTNNVANGLFSKGVRLRVQGYQTTRGDFTGTRPLVQASGAITNFTLMSCSGGGSYFTNIEFDGALKTGSKAALIRGGFYECIFRNCVGNAITASTIAQCINCYFTGNTGQAASGAISFYGCVATGNTATPFSSAGEVFERCIAYANTGATTDGFNPTAENVKVINCVAYGNGRHGFNMSSTSGSININCIAEGNTGTGFLLGSNEGYLFTNAYYNNGTNVNLSTAQLSFNLNGILGTSSFFTNAGTGDFSLNNTAGGGAAVRDLAIPLIFPAGLTTNYMDLGAAQHQATGGGGGEASAVF